jgi:metal-responsive CopG/Arc/MetJ family transcriptional regulator
MTRKKVERRGKKAGSPSWVRASISFPEDVHRSLEDIAREKKVSLAWVVRDASEKYITNHKAAG